VVGGADDKKKSTDEPHSFFAWGVWPWDWVDCTKSVEPRICVVAMRTIAQTRGMVGYGLYRLYKLFG
jgi:hypothetical protein